MRRHQVAFATAIAAIAPTTAAHAAVPGPKLENAYKAAYEKAHEPGRDILRMGIEKPGANRPATVRELRRSIGVLHRTAKAPAGGGSVASPALEAIAACESGGDPTAVDASGTYRGKYQFDLPDLAVRRRLRRPRRRARGRAGSPRRRADGPGRQLALARLRRLAPTASRSGRHPRRGCRSARAAPPPCW